MSNLTFDSASGLFLIGIILGVWLILSINLIKAIVRLLRPNKSYGWVIFPDPRTKQWVVIAWQSKSDGIMIVDFESKHEAERYARLELRKHFFKQTER